MKPYPTYKDSGIEWLGKIPAHWNATKLKHLDEVIMGQSPNSDDYNSEIFGLPFLQGNADFKSLHPEPRVWCDTANKIAKKNDVLLSVRAPIGAVNIADQEYGIGRGLCAIRANVTLPRLLYYFALALHEELNREGTGSTYTAVSVDEIRNVFVPEIPFPEQRAIADYLDRKTGQIDTLIEKKQRQIELLKEQRTALINQAVTKGLNPDALMKDSGIEWLGSVPTHWGVTLLKYVAFLQRGHDLPSQDRQVGDVPIVSSSGISGWHNEVMAQGPGVVTGRYGTIGHIHYVEQDYWPHNTTLYVKYFRGNYPRYIYYLLKLLPFEAFSTKSAVPGVDRNDLHELYVCLPPLDEQEWIAKYLDEKLDEFQLAENNIRNTIEKFQEYHTTLISEAVTGKIDVRGL